MRDNHASNQPDSRSDLPEADDRPPSSPFDFSSLLAAVVTQWRRVGAGGLVFLLLGLAAAVAILRPSYTVAVQLSRYEPPLASDSFKPQPLTTAALFGLISSPDFLQKTGARLTPPLTAEQLAQRLQIAEDRPSELITVTATAGTPAGAVSLANLAGLESVQLTQAMQKAEAIEAGRLITGQLTDSEADRTRVKAQLAEIETLRADARQKEQAMRQSANAPSAAKIDTANVARLEERTQAARDALADLQARYTEKHPLVREQQARLAVLEAQLLQSVAALPPAAAAPAAILPVESAAASSDQSTGYDALALRLGILENTRAELVARQRAIEFFATHPPGYLHLAHDATAANVVAHRNRLAIGAVALLCAALGTMFTVIAIVIRELLDVRLKTGADVRRVTHLPLLATLGELDTMSPASQANWAFRTWTALQHRLSVSANHGLVCGFASSSHGEGRSTWIGLLAQAARQCGFRVLTISAPATDSPRPAPKAPGPAVLGLVTVGTQTFASLIQRDPAQLAENLALPGPVEKIDLPYPGGWARNREHRKEWEHAINSWGAIESVVIFVELPPADDPEAVLLAQSLPNLVWLAQSHKADARETLEQLETLRNGRCLLVGAVLNREPAAPLKQRFARWFGYRSTVIASVMGLAGSPGAAQTLAAKDSAPPPPALALVVPAQRAAWQQRLTLGPGDLLNLSMFGQPELTQTQVPIGPDGRVNYLEAENVMAAGLTVDEFRAALNTALAQFRRAPEVVVAPAAYRSKKFYVMGSVVKKGAFTLDRPTTVIEALSLAQGFAPVPADRNQAISADLAQSFLSRDGRHVPVDFAKLFLDGDLSQNIPLEPGDYLYFPPGDPEEVYVLGEVRFPGPAPFAPQTTSLEAIAARGGFSDRAWQGRLLVIRGTLDHPQAFVVNARDVLSAKTADFTLQPRDIVYVSSRPWIRGEELLDTAVSAFLQSAVVTATGRYIYNSNTLPTTTP